MLVNKTKQRLPQISLNPFAYFPIMTPFIVLQLKFFILSQVQRLESEITLYKLPFI